MVASSALAIAVALAGAPVAAQAAQDRPAGSTTQPADAAVDRGGARLRHPALQADAAGRHADLVPPGEARAALRRMHALMQRGAEAMPTHAGFLSGERTG
ncbi:hypothetical protein V8201_17260 [Sphingomonas kyungheensis]|uniref:Uncharacterized protein n=1 Tax=Sphingomonas kyungheensis TaxID=1069987 RepID=A0ABU8H797_9SPHN